MLTAQHIIQAQLRNDQLKRLKITRHLPGHVFTHNPVWLITGCSQGIGLALTRHALSEGHVVIATSRNPAASPALVSEVEAAGSHWLALDVTSPDLEDVVRRAEALYGRIDVLVNNAAYAVMGAVEEVPVEVYRDQMETNFLGPVRIMQAVLPGMRARKSGCIINVSSAAGIVSAAGNGVYSASKFALGAVSEALSREVEGFGIRVAVMVLGAFRTRFGSDGARVVKPRDGGGYDGAHVVSKRLEMVKGLNEKAEGDPGRAAGVMFEVAMGREGVKGKDGARFLMLVLGEDGWVAAWKKIEDLRETWEAQREYAKVTAMVE